MANWSQLVAHVKANYNVAEQNDGMLRLHFTYDNGRTQVVFVWHVQARNGEDWIHIESPIGELGEIDLRALLELVEKKVVGGAAACEGFVVLREAVPLADMSVEEFESPFRFITATADEFEHQLAGVDRY